MFTNKLLIKRISKYTQMYNRFVINISYSDQNFEHLIVQEIGIMWPDFKINNFAQFEVFSLN